jgi:hypothetical protein
VGSNYLTLKKITFTEQTENKSERRTARQDGILGFTLPPLICIRCNENAFDYININYFLTQRLHFTFFSTFRKNENMYDFKYCVYKGFLA